MRNRITATPEQQARAIKRYETHKETAQAKAETRARKARRADKYSTARVAY